MGKPLVEIKIWETVKMDPIKPEEIVREVYHHGVVIGLGNPDEIRVPQKPLVSKEV